MKKTDKIARNMTQQLVNVKIMTQLSTCQKYNIIISKNTQIPLSLAN